MGNYKFRLSDMMPNAWFYKLKEMGNRPRNHSSTTPPSQIKKKTHHKSVSSAPSSFNHHQPPPQFTNHRHSYYITSDPNTTQDKLYNSPINPKSSDVHFPDQPRKSTRRRRRRSTSSFKSSSTNLVPSSVSAPCVCKTTLNSVSSTPDYSASVSVSPPDTSPEGSLFPEFGSSWSSSCSCRISSSTADIIIDVDSRVSSISNHKFDGLDSICEIELPPILTKPAKFNDMVSEIRKRETTNVKLGRVSTMGEKGNMKNRKQQKISPPTRRISPNSPGLKLRLNSPKIASKKIQAINTNAKARRRSFCDSFAIVKSSFDPQKDFRESMVEMIVENNIRAPKDLEELLACYLSLNSNEYHDIIVKVFEQIWFDLTDVHL